MYTKTKTIARKPIPEKAGRSAIRWATPMVNGLVRAAEKPKAVANKLIPRPVNESQPRDQARATAKGTKGTISSKMPSSEPKSMKNKVIRHSSKYFRFPTAATILAIAAASTPVFSRAAKDPPIIRMNKMIEITIMLSGPHRTSKGAVNQRHTG